MAHENETTTDPAERPPGPIEDLQRRLDLNRGLRTLRRTDALQRLTERVRHDIETSRTRAEARRERRTRREENRDATEAGALADLRRRATVSGERARVRSEIMQSAEMRALRVERVRRASLYVLLPVLLAFAAWSTTSVHNGVTRILNVADGSPMWLTAWGVEPALITIVAGVIIVRSILRSAGGDLDGRATVAEWAALTASIALAAAGHWSGWSLGALVAVAVACVGPLGAALTAWLIGVIDDAVASARPYERDGERAPTLADLSVSEAPKRSSSVPVQASEREAITQANPVERPGSLSESDYARLLSGEPSGDAPEEPAAAERPTQPVSGPVSERRKIVAQLLTERPDMTGPELAEALTEAGHPVSVPTAKRDRAAVTGE